MVQLRQPVSPATQAVSTTSTLVTVQDIDLTNLIATVVDQLGASRKVSLKFLPGKSVDYPRPGEMWLITSSYGDWMFLCSANVPPTLGPQGPQGAQGAQGPQGATGAQGPQGAAGLESYSRSFLLGGM